MTYSTEKLNKRTVDGTVRTVIECSTAAQCVAGSIFARNKYLHNLCLVVPGLAICNALAGNAHTEIIPNEFDKKNC